MGEILANAVAVAQNIFNGRGDVCDVGVEIEFGIDSMCQVLCRLGKWPAFRERRLCIAAQLGKNADQFRWVTVFARKNHGLAAAALDLFPRGLPGQVGSKVELVSIDIHFHLTLDSHLELCVRLLDRKVGGVVAEIVLEVTQRPRVRLDQQPEFSAALAGVA